MEYLLPYEEILLEREREQGIKQGELQHARKTLIMLIESRFGMLTAEVLEKVKSANYESVDAWMNRFLLADSLDEVWS